MDEEVFVWSLGRWILMDEEGGVSLVSRAVDSDG